MCPLTWSPLLHQTEPAADRTSRSEVRGVLAVGDRQRSLREGAVEPACGAVAHHPAHQTEIGRARHRLAGLAVKDDGYGIG